MQWPSLFKNGFRTTGQWQWCASLKYKTRCGTICSRRGIAERRDFGKCRFAICQLTILLSVETFRKIQWNWTNQHFQSSLTKRQEPAQYSRHFSHVPMVDQVIADQMVTTTFSGTCLIIRIQHAFRDLAVSSKETAPNSAQHPPFVRHWSKPIDEMSHFGSMGSSQSGSDRVCCRGDRCRFVSDAS